MIPPVRGARVAVLATSILVLAGACGPAADPGAMAAVQVSATGTPPAGCRVLASLEGKDADRWVPGGPYYEKAVSDLRRQAALGGGNYLFIDTVVPPRDTDYLPAYVVRARLFSCPSPATPGPPSTPAPGPSTPLIPPSASSAPPALICEPECSPSYTCLRGKCVSVCNPLCAAGERCGVDRICHPASSVTPAAPP